MRRLLIFLLLLLPMGINFRAQECRQLPEHGQRLGVTSTAGLIVLDVSQDSIAAHAGLKPGDFIKDVSPSITPRTVNGFDNFSAAIRERALWHLADVTVIVDGESRRLMFRRNTPDDNLGFASQPGFLVEKVREGGWAQRAGLKAGDFITAIDGISTASFRSPVDLDSRIDVDASLHKGKLQVSQLTVLRGGQVGWKTTTITLDSDGPLDGPVPPAGLEDPGPDPKPRRIKN